MFAPKRSARRHRSPRTCSMSMGSSPSRPATAASVTMQSTTATPGWLIGDADRHYAYHTDTALVDMVNDPLSCAPPQLGTSRASAAAQHARCPCCLFNDKLPGRARWRTL